MVEPLTEMAWCCWWDSLCTFSAVAKRIPASFGLNRRFSSAPSGRFPTRFVLHLLCCQHVSLEPAWFPAFLLMVLLGFLPPPVLLVEILFRDSYCSVQVLPNNLKTWRPFLPFLTPFRQKHLKWVDGVVYFLRMWLIMVLNNVFLNWRCFP